MKCVYTTYIELKVLLKNGREYRFHSDNMSGRNCYLYGEIPESKETKLTLSEYINKDNRMFHIKSGRTLFKRRTYEVFRSYPKDIRIYSDEIDSVVIKNGCKLVENPRIEWLEKDLGFKGYSELVFDREQELKKLMMKV